MSYSLNVISHLSEFKGRSFKKHGIEGVETIGVFGNEPFEVIFKNNSYKTVQVKLSVDGTDVLTGTTANTSSIGDMFQVAPYSKLALKAWPETTKGGAQFIFTNAEKSVTVNTHGNLSSRGVIAAAVFVEDYVAPHKKYNNIVLQDCVKGMTTNSSTMDYFDLDLRREINDNDVLEAAPTGARFEKELFSEENRLGSLNGRRSARSRKKELKSLAAVGAGQHVEQNIRTVEGFIKPALVETVQVRYLWWDDLVSEIKEQNKNVSSGFPGDEIKIMSLGNTPRLEQNVVKVELSRF